MLESLQNPKVRKIIEDVIGGCDQQTATVLDISFVRLDFIKKLYYFYKQLRKSNNSTVHLYSQLFLYLLSIIFKLYTCEEGKHKFHHCKAEGILVFLIDRREGKAFYLRVLHAATLEVKFSVELYYGFVDKWTPVRGFNNFYAFPFSKGYIGMLFINESEASRVSLKIRQYAPSKKDLEKINLQIKEEEKQLKAYQQQQKEKDSFSYQFKAFFGKEKVEKPVQIGTPQNVKRTTLNLNVETGEIDIDKLPPVLIEVFLNAGITKKDLQDKGKAKEIFKAVAKFSDKSQLTTTNQLNQQNNNQRKSQQQVTTQPTQKQNPVQTQQQSKPLTSSITIINIKINMVLIYKSQNYYQLTFQSNQSIHRILIFMGLSSQNLLSFIDRLK